ncbi:hydroxysqualene dehydroxylase HpnE [Inquilinus limosus]|uniref:hydroxysqualene dehydroxylase HpnE n=1 Tax=Inquilinus limosus TaxID=171674 RepID=UPI000402E8F1|nr:hydroxysqualene dehydroxylase HpnE [Inquilinus limosus]
MTAHVIGGGLSGLAAAVELARTGTPAVVYEATARPGGRCRAFHEPALDRVIDNGNHLVLSGNRNVRRYLELIGAADRLAAPARPGFRFVDLERGREFTLRPNRGRLPWWILRAGRRVPGTRPRDYLALRRLAKAGPGDTVAGMVPQGELYRCLIEPLAVSALNTPADEASARSLWAVVEQTLAKGGAQTIPLIARTDLADTFINPALDFLHRHRVTVRTGMRIKTLEIDEGRITALELDQGTLPLAPDDQVILAVPPAIAARLAPGLTPPEVDEPIVNGHFAIPLREEPHDIAGIVGGTAHWVFRRPGIASTTVSAARGLVDEPAEQLAPRLWADVVRAFPDLAGPLPAHRIIKEKRATIRQSPADEARRPPCPTPYANLWLAGDWTATGLPATIEGSLLSGFRAADHVRSTGTVTASARRRGRRGRAGSEPV